MESTAHSFPFLQGEPGRFLTRILSALLLVMWVTSQMECCWAIYRSFQAFLPALPIRWGWGPHSTAGRAIPQLSCLDMGRSSPRTTKTPSLKTQIRQTCIPLSSPVQTTPLTWSRR